MGQPSVGACSGEEQAAFGDDAAIQEALQAEGALSPTTIDVHMALAHNLIMLGDLMTPGHTALGRSLRAGGCCCIVIRT